MPTNVCLVKAMVFPVVMYGCESWTVKKAECQRIDAFVLWCWRRLLRVPWTARRSNQSILKEISPEYSLEGLMLKLKLQYFGHLMWRTDSLEKTLMLGRLKAGGEGDERGWDGWMALPTQWTWIWASSRSWWWTGKPGLLPWGWKELDRTEGLNWLTTSGGFVAASPLISNCSAIWNSEKFMESRVLLQGIGNQRPPCPGVPQGPAQHQTYMAGTKTQPKPSLELEPT